MIVDLPDVKIMYVVSSSGVSGSRRAFDKLESKLLTLKGRKFYGLVYGIPPIDTYWSAVALADADSPEKLGLKTGVIPAGKYVQERINNWNENVLIVGETFQRLAKQYKVDPSRPSVEFYRSMRDMLVRLPIIG